MKHNRILTTASFVLLSLLTHACSGDTERFRIDTNNNTVVDATTGLTWKRCVEGQTGNDCSGNPTPYAWSEAQEAAEQSDGWRVPTIQELESLADESLSNPSIDSDAFPNTPDFIHWSSSPDDMGNEDNAMSMGFDDATVYYSNKQGRYYLRMVRD